MNITGRFALSILVLLSIVSITFAEISPPRSLIPNYNSDSITEVSNDDIAAQKILDNPDITDSISESKEQDKTPRTISQFEQFRRMRRSKHAYLQINTIILLFLLLYFVCLITDGGLSQDQHGWLYEMLPTSYRGIPHYRLLRLTIQPHH